MGEPLCANEAGQEFLCLEVGGPAMQQVRFTFLRDVTVALDGFTQALHPVWQLKANRYVDSHRIDLLDMRCSSPDFSFIVLYQCDACFGKASSKKHF